MPDPGSSDGELMRAVMKEDTSALVQLIERWESRLLAFVFRYVQNESVARDLVQETFVRIYQARERFDPAKSFSSWMFAIAANLCRNHQRWTRRHRETSLESVAESMDTEHPVRRIARTESQQRIADALAALPHSLRVSVLLYYFEDLSYAEISDITGCSVRGVESRLYRARKILQKLLGEPDELSRATPIAESGHIRI